MGKELPFLAWQGIGYLVLLGNPPSQKESERFRKETAQQIHLPFINIYSVFRYMAQL